VTKDSEPQHVDEEQGTLKRRPALTERWLANDALVPTNRGLLRISELKPGEKLLGSSWTWLEKKVGVGVKPTYRLDTIEGSYVEGGKELVINTDGVPTPMLALHKGDKIAIDQKPGGFSRIQTKFFKLPLPLAKQRYSTEPNIGEEGYLRLDPDLAYVLGWFLMAGSFSNEGKRLEWRYATDDQQIHKALKAFCERWGFRFTQKEKELHNNRIVLFQIDSAQLATFFERLGLARGSDSAKSIPPHLFESPQSVVFSFLRSAFTCGSFFRAINPSERVVGSLVSAHVDFLRQVKIALHRLRIFCTILKKEQDDLFELALCRESVEPFLERIACDMADVSYKAELLPMCQPYETVGAIRCIGEQKMFSLETGTGDLIANSMLVRC